MKLRKVGSVHKIIIFINQKKYKQPSFGCYNIIGVVGLTKNMGIRSYSIIVDFLQ